MIWQIGQKYCLVIVMVVCIKEIEKHQFLIKDQNYISEGLSIPDHISNGSSKNTLISKQLVKLLLQEVQLVEQQVIFGQIILEIKLIMLPSY